MFNYLFFLTAHGKEVTGDAGETTALMNTVPRGLNPVPDGETVRNSLFF